MTTTETPVERLRGEYHSIERKQGMTVGEAITFLEQFDRRQELAVYVLAEDRTEWVGLYTEGTRDYEVDDGHVPWPMMVVSYTEDRD